MFLDHFEQIAPVCPVCVLSGRGEQQLVIGAKSQVNQREILEGSLVCSHCRFEYPILQAIPIIAANVREIVRNQWQSMQHSEQSSFAQSFLADCYGPDSEFERDRYRLGAYAHAHWADLGTGTSLDETVAASGAAALSKTAFGLVAPPTGTWLDIGASVGRNSVELVRAGANLVVACDLNLAMLALFERGLRSGVLQYWLRQVGVVYERRSVDLTAIASLRDKIAVWACDATSLPIRSQSVDGALSFNLLDCIALPINHLAEVSRVLRQHGTLLLTSPFDWSTAATPFEAWIGGHTQRGPLAGSSQQDLQRIFGPTDPGNLGIMLERSAEAPWAIRVHERATMHYRAFVAAARKT